MHVLNTRFSVSLGFILLAVASATLTGCPQGADLEDEDRFEGNSGGSAGTGGGSGSCEQCDVHKLIEQTCLGLGCHGASNFAGALDLESPNVESRLLNVPAWAARADEISNPDTCDLTEMRVDGNDPSKSALIEKLQGTQSCGVKMPLAVKFQGDANAAIACFTRWSYCMAGKDPNGGSGGTGSGGTGSGGTAGTGGTGSGGTAGTGGTGSGGTAGTGSGGTSSGGSGGSGGSAGSTGGTGGSTGGSGGSAP